ncbi:MAG: hypothetical protein EXS15_03255 [Phycisphaerales bacterium]|nr:hypothetical protein [Phycisphaerales bacterium]
MSGSPGQSTRSWEETASATDAIVAISSGPGSSARGIVRISGDGTFDIANQRISPRASCGSIVARRLVQMVRIRVKIAGESVEIPVLALAMVGPNSFTGQDTVELLVAGQPALLAAIIDAICDPSLGSMHARRATPGEFSARAYLNGKIDIAQAESIALSIAAESDTQLDAARQLRSSRVSQIAHDAAEEVTGLLALVEAGIDFSDQEDVVAITSAELAQSLGEIQSAIAAAVDRAAPEESLRALPVIALRGATNAGKSSLFNALIGRERVVASPTAGSTRDAIVETVTLHRGREALIMDLPGIADPTHALEEEMQELARHAFDAATLQLHCVPLTSGAHAYGGSAMLTVWTKADCADSAARHEAKAQGGVITSAQSGEGIEALRKAIAHAIDQSSSSSTQCAPIVLSHHRAALAHAHQAICRVAASVDACVRSGRRAAEPAELIASDLRDALDALGIVAGHRTPDDVLGALFARFCIGK